VPPSIETRGLLAYDENALYIGIVCRTPYPDRLVADQRQRDAFGIWMDESVEVFLASPDSPERYAHFIINARGTVYDELCFDVGWNTEITVATHTDNQGWKAEIAIPWKSLPFDVDLNATGKPLLRLNLGRNHHQRGEEEVSHWAWSPTFGWFHNTQRFGVVMRQQGNILVKSVTPPSYVDDPPIQLTVLNLSEREEDVEVAGRRVAVPARGEATIEVPSPKTPGDYQYRLQVRWRDGEVTVPTHLLHPAPDSGGAAGGDSQRRRRQDTGCLRPAQARGASPDGFGVRHTIAAPNASCRSRFHLEAERRATGQAAGTPMGGGVRELVGGGRGAPAAEIGCHHPRSHSRAEQQAGRLPLNQKHSPQFEPWATLAPAPSYLTNITCWQVSRWTRPSWARAQSTSTLPLVTSISFL
jgi:hypothetical protein